MLWSAFVLGVVGSLHCVGMCGPIAMLVSGNNKWQFVRNRLLYHAGRTAMYMAMGALVGLFGRIIDWAGYQNFISIGAGILILLVLLIPGIQVRLFPAITGRILPVKKWFGSFIHSSRPANNLMLGVLNGLLPCGLVYSALALALIQPGVQESVVVMALFGAGTVPALLLFVYSADSLRKLLPVAFSRVQTFMLVVVATIMIWRGIAFQSGLDPVTGQVVTSCHSDN